MLISGEFRSIALLVVMDINIVGTLLPVMESGSKTIRMKPKTAADNNYFGLLTVSDEKIIEIIESHPYVMARLGE